MSLRAIHAIIIFLSILLLFFFGYWVFSGLNPSRGPLHLCLGIVSFAAGILLVPYLVWFIMKTRRQKAS